MGEKWVLIPDKDDFDLGWRALDYGGCILVTVAKQDLLIDLKGYKNIDACKYVIQSMTRSHTL